LKQWADYKEISYTSNENLLSNEKVIEKFDREIAKYNAEFAKWETVKKFKLIAKEWSIETGELTPTLKLKRNVVMEKCCDLVDAIYAE
jgi:long-chain acyl-CoA synthetase